MKEEYSLHALYCCGNMLSLYHGFYVIAFHCLLQGFYGFSLICSSTHKNSSGVINFTAISSNLLIMATGILIIWIYVTDRFRWSKLCSVCIIIFTLFNICAMATYFHRYFYFKANTTLESGILAGDPAEILPFTMWHMFVGISLLASIAFFYYAYVFWVIPSDVEK